MMCVNSTSTFTLGENQFIYSPTAQQYAAGMLSHRFGIYRANGYGTVNSTAVWAASQGSMAYVSYLAAQNDRNLVVYGVNGTGTFWPSGTNNGGTGRPFCLQMLDSGTLIWFDNTMTIIWQANATGAFG